MRRLANKVCIATEKHDDNLCIAEASFRVGYCVLLNSFVDTFSCKGGELGSKR